MTQLFVELKEQSPSFYFRTTRLKIF